MSNLRKSASQLHRHYNTLITGDIHPVDHPVAKGDAREHGWRELFRRFFPNRYGIKSGFIIDSLGNESKQIDCIIYRKDIGIELYSVGHHTVIPVEAVFGAFEIKPCVSAKNLKDAKDKADSISKLKISNILTRNNAGESEVSDKLHPVHGSIITGILADKILSNNKWDTVLIKKFFRRPDSNLSVFMTVDDGCADTLSTAYPAKEYTYYDGDEALLTQFITLLEVFEKLEKDRFLGTSIISRYKSKLRKPRQITVEI